MEGDLIHQVWHYYGLPLSNCAAILLQAPNLTLQLSKVVDNLL